ncbi:hypothetical protein FB446DRAFT_718062 [Lentinula raphanica]|nr:hypothetical protein FB446DRAFT_718062 [Lentinula raphanica]
MPVVHNRPLTKDEYPALFRTMLKSALHILNGERARTGKFTKDTAATKLVAQLTAWAYNHDPFGNSSWTSSTKPLEYWMPFMTNPSANILATIAVKVFSILPSEICDERTASSMGWLNSARRSSITPQNLIDSAKLRDYYANGGYSDNAPSTGPSNGKTHAFVHVPDVAQPIGEENLIRSAPTLMDLVNDTDVEVSGGDAEALEELWFNHPDPYDLGEVGQVDEERGAHGASPAIIRSSDRFAVAEYVKLDSEELSALIKAHGSVADHQPMSVDIDDDLEGEGQGSGWSVADFL